LIRSAKTNSRKEEIEKGTEEIKTLRMRTPEQDRNGFLFEKVRFMDLGHGVFLRSCATAA